MVGIEGNTIYDIIQHILVTTQRLYNGGLLSPVHEEATGKLGRTDIREARECVSNRRVNEINKCKP